MTYHYFASFLRRYTGTPKDFLLWVARWFFGFGWITAGLGIVVTRSASGVEIAVDPATTDDDLDTKVKADDTDPDAGYLDAKVQYSVEVDATAHALQLVGDEDDPTAWSAYAKNATEKNWEPLTQINFVEDVRYNNTNQTLERKVSTCRVFDYQEGSYEAFADDDGSLADSNDKAADLVAGETDAVGRSDGLWSFSSNWALAAWVDVNSTGYILAATYIDGGGIGWTGKPAIYHAGSGTLDCYVSEDGDGAYKTLTGTGFTGAPSHLVLTYNSSDRKLRIYRDGSYQAVVTLDAGTYTIQHFRIGCLRSEAGNVTYASLGIDKMGVWQGISWADDTARDNWVASIYNGGDPQSYAELSAAQKTSLAHWYDFDNDLTDEVGSKNLSTQTGTVAYIAGY